jgi:hypothetical protein
MSLKEETKQLLTYLRTNPAIRNQIRAAPGKTLLLRAGHRAAGPLETRRIHRLAGPLGDFAANAVGSVSFHIGGGVSPDE